MKRRVRTNRERLPWAVDKKQRFSGQGWLYCHACGGTFAYDDAAMSSVEAGQRHWLAHSAAFRQAVTQLAVDMREVVYQQPTTIVESEGDAA